LINIHSNHNPKLGVHTCTNAMTNLDLHTHTKHMLGVYRYTHKRKAYSSFYCIMREERNKGTYFQYLHIFFNRYHFSERPNGTFRAVSELTVNNSLLKHK
jgi:hypothetical protein